MFPPKGGTEKRGTTEANGTDTRTSERAVVPVKLGNHAEGTQWRKGRADSQSCWRERPWGRQAPIRSQRNNSG